ncbi:MAG: TolC family protein [Myxococcales bacterium]|nr:TolC family protein [Myxococcales bacterium]
MVRPALVATLSMLALASSAQAEPLTFALRLVADPDGAGATPVSPLIGALTGPAERADLPALIDRALRSDPDLARVDVDLAIAAAAIDRARAWDDWAVGADASASTRVANDSRVWAAGVSGDLTRALSTGGVAGVRFEGGWADTPLAPGVYTESITASITQPLLRGRGEELVLAAERAARVDRDATALAGDAAAVAVVEEVVLAYFDLIAAERELAIRIASLELAGERLRVTEAGIKAGGVAAAERISVQQAIATREEDILAGEVTVIEKSLALRRATGLTIGPGQLLLETDVALAIPTRTWDTGALLAAALAYSPEAAQLRAREAGATIEVMVGERGVLPALDLALSLGPSGSADDPGTAAVDMITFDEFAAALSLSYRTTLGEVAARATARTARAQRERVRIDASDLEKQIALAITRAVIAVNAAERRHALAVRTIDLAEQALAAEQARLASGKSRNVDVLARQDELRAAQLRQIRAIVEWHRAATTIAGLTGELLPRYGVTVSARGR